MPIRICVITAWLALGCASCSGGGDETAGAKASENHVWKDQVETMETARDVEKALRESATAKLQATGQDSQ